MKCRDELVGNPDHGISKFCFAKENDTYLVYLPDGGTSELNLTGAKGTFDVKWFNPRTGGALQSGTVKSIQGGNTVTLGMAPSDQEEDWLVVIRGK